MQPIEIIVILIAVAIVAGVIGCYIYKRLTHQPTGECSCCSNRMKKNFKKISKELQCECLKKENE